MSVGSAVIKVVKWGWKAGKRYFSEHPEQVVGAIEAGVGFAEHDEANCISSAEGRMLARKRIRPLSLKLNGVSFPE